MSFTMITERHNCDDGYISLVDVKLKGLPESIDVAGYTLFRKSEFHVSLVCLKQLDDILKGSDLLQKKDEIKNIFLDYVKHHDLCSFTLSKKYRLVRRGDRVTVIAMVDIPSIEGLFAAIKKRANVEIPTQVTHITLYTLQPDRGIGIISVDQLAPESQMVNLPILSNIRTE